MTSHPKIVAFRVDVTDMPEASCVVRTTKPSRAKFLAWDSMREVGYNLPFSRFKVRRARQFDGYVASLQTGRLYSMDYANNMLLPAKPEHTK